MKSRVLTITSAQGRMQKIRVSVELQNKEGMCLKNIPAIIDTGATNTFISKRIIQSLKLTPVSRRVISRTSAGEMPVYRYIISLKLPQDILFPGLITYSFVGFDDLDVLIGMDVITAGDFAITEDNGLTVVSYRIPHLNKYIDFLKE